MAQCCPHIEASSPDITATIQHPHTHTHTKHVYHLKIGCVTHLHEVASHPYSSSVAERDGMAQDLQCRSEGSCFHICRRLLFSGRVQHCVYSNTTDAVFHLEWSVSASLSVHLLYSSLPVLFCPSWPVWTTTRMCTHLYIIRATAHIITSDDLVPENKHEIWKVECQESLWGHVR